MKRSKRAFMTILAVVMAMSMTMWLCSCGSDDTAGEEQTGMANPVHECESSDEVCQATNVSIDAPEGATDVSYGYIDAAEEDEQPIAQVIFTFDGQEYCYRGQFTSETSLFPEQDPDDSNFSEAAKDQTEACAKLSGMYCDWKAGGALVVSNRDGVCGINKGKEGYIAWLDVVPGVMYSLSVNKGADQQKLLDMAEKCFVPMQGEA